MVCLDYISAWRRNKGKVDCQHVDKDLIEHKAFIKMTSASSVVPLEDNQRVQSTIDTEGGRRALLLQHISGDRVSKYVLESSLAAATLTTNTRTCRHSRAHVMHLEIIPKDLYPNAETARVSIRGDRQH